MKQICKLCTTYDFKEVGITNDFGKWHINLPGKLYKHNRFKYCTECGKKLTKENFYKD